MSQNIFCKYCHRIPNKCNCTHPVKEQDESFDRTASHMAGEYVSYKAELTDEDRSMLIRTLKWSEDLLRVAGHDEAVSDVQDCIILLRKASEK